MIVNKRNKNYMKPQLLKRCLTQAVKCSFYLLFTFSIVSCACLQPMPKALPIIHDAVGMRDMQLVQTVQFTGTEKSVSDATEGGQDTKQINDQQNPQLIVVTTIQNSEFKVVGLNAVGQRMFTMSSAKGEFSVEKSSLLPEDVPLAQMLALMQFVLWPDQRLQTVYAKPWEIRESNKEKQLLRSSALVLSAHFDSKNFSDSPWESATLLIHERAGIRVQIEPVEVTYP